MAYEIEAEILAFGRHLLGARPWLGLGEPQRGRIMILAAEQPMLPAVALAHRGFGDRQKQLGVGQNLRPVWLETVETTTPGQPFELAPVHRPLRHAAEHIFEVFDGTGSLALLDDLLHGLLADVANTGERVAHGMAVLGRLDAELGLALVD